MPQSTDEEQGALKLAEIIEETAKNPEKAAQRIEEKISVTLPGGSKGVLKTILGFIKDYKNKKPDQSNEDWLKEQFAKPEYADAWKDAEELDAAAKELIQGVEDYENAKKSLASHIEMGGNRESWLAQQIEIGAAVNNKDPAEYAKEVYEGLNDAREENAEFLLDSAMTKEDK
jgi:hypothetical protein